MNKKYVGCAEKGIFLFICTVFFFSFNALFAEQIRNLKKEFIKQDIAGKTAVIQAQQQNSEDFAALGLFALDFVHTNYPLLFSDDDFILLARETVKKMPASSDAAAASLLEKIFVINENPALQTDILENFAASADDSSFKERISTIRLINAYTEKLSVSVNVSVPSKTDTALLIRAIKTLGDFKHISSFPVLFACCGVSDKSVSDEAVKALDNFNGVYEKEIRAVISDGSIQEKQLALDLVLDNPKNSDFFKAEMAENALSQTVYKTDGNAVCTEECIALKMKALRELYRVSWTRSTALIRQLFFDARKEYDAGLLTDNQFIEIIYAFTRLASTEASVHLSNYLQELNKKQEQNNGGSVPVVLAVIQSLQLLGDKTAFDDLLYATYQNYPEEVLSAARDALSKLKW